MGEFNDGEKVEPVKLLTLQIIAGALLTGVLVFASYVLLLAPQSDPPVEGDPPLPLMTYMSLGFLAMALAVRFVVPAQIVKANTRGIAQGSSLLAGAPTGRAQTGKTTDTDLLLASFQTTSIIGWALLEGAAFMGCVMYMMEHNPLAWATISIPVILLILTFPTRGRLEAWLDRQQAAIQEIRRAEGFAAKS